LRDHSLTPCVTLEEIFYDYSKYILEHNINQEKIKKIRNKIIKNRPAQERKSEIKRDGQKYYQVNQRPYSIILLWQRIGNKQYF
jgi:hypothetical protein